MNPGMTTEQILLVKRAIVNPFVVDLKFTDIIKNTSPGQDYYGRRPETDFWQTGEDIVILIVRAQVNLIVRMIIRF